MAASASVERTLGIILGKIEGIEDRMEKAEASRATVHRRLDESVARTSHLENEMGLIKTKLEGMERVTVQTTTLITKAEGAGTLGRWLVRVGIGVVTVAGWMIGVYTWLTGRPPP